MADRLSKASRWRHAGRLATELHELLRVSVEAYTGAPPESPADALVQLHRVDRNIRMTLARIREQDLREAVRRAVARIADDVLARTSEQHPTQRLKDVVRGFGSYRAQRMLRARVEERKRHQISEAVRRGAVLWDSPVSKAEDFGRGMDERVVEMPLAFEVARFQTGGRVLDAGAALNHGFLRALIDPPVAELVHFTQSGEREEARFAATQVSYVFGDLRSLPFRDAYFDRVVCISTLEHVGMNNARYGGGSEHAPGSTGDAIRELLRVLTPDGTMLITVPYGPPADHGWYRTFGAADVSRLIEDAKATHASVRYYRFGGSWYLSDAREEAVPLDVTDDTATVRAVAAIKLRK